MKVDWGRKLEVAPRSSALSPHWSNINEDLLEYDEGQQNFQLYTAGGFGTQSGLINLTLPVRSRHPLPGPLDQFKRSYTLIFYYSLHYHRFQMRGAIPMLKVCGVAAKDLSKINEGEVKE